MKHVQRKDKLIRKNTISNGGGKITTTLNLEKLILNRDDSHNIRIYDEDTIVIGKLKNSNQNNISSAVKFRMNPKYVKVIIGGRVNAPGVLTLTRFSTLNDAIDMAGGAKVLKGPTTFVRFNNDGTIDKRKFRLSKNSKRGSRKNPFLKSGDIIYVGNSPYNVASEVITEFTRPFANIYGSYKFFSEVID